MFSQKVLAVLGKADYVVIFILLGLSVLNVAIILERWFFYYSVGQRPARFRQLWEEFLLNPTLPKWQELSALYSFWEIQLLRDLLAKPMGPVREAYFQLWWETFKGRLEKNLGLLATLASNAPYLGLLGTVFGIMKAFLDLSRAQDSAIGQVMASISGALLATAVGLLVAIPAVLAYNHFMKNLKELGRKAQQAKDLSWVLSQLTGES